MTYSNDFEAKVLQELTSLNSKFDGLEGRFDGLEGKFDGLEGKFNGLNADVKGIKTKVGELDDKLSITNAKLTRIDDKIDDQTTELRAEIRTSNQYIGQAFAHITDFKNATSK